MSGRKVTITIDDVLYEEMNKRARVEGFDRVPNLIRYLLTREMRESEHSEKRKVVTVLLDNYDEIALYVREKKLGSVPIFAGFAMEQQMQRVPLTQAQKGRIEKSIG